eukprot:gene2382-2618_t
MTTAELFDQNFLSVHSQLLSSLSQAKVCIDRGSLVKLLHVADLKYKNKQYKSDFVLNITKRSYADNTYLVVEDTGAWDNAPAYGHTIANRLTTLVDEKYSHWYHYDYHLVGLGDNFDGPHDFSIRHRLYSREDLKQIVPKDTYLKLLGIVKSLLIGVVTAMGPFEKAQLVFELATGTFVSLKTH